MSDATPAYRGYRLQTLYILSRILECNNKTDLIFQPEGAEDLAIWNKNDHLLEVVQVKAFSGNLTLSSLAPNKNDSFLYRVNELIKSYPNTKIKIASFGSIGEELLEALQKKTKARKQVIQKISEKGFLSEVEAHKLLNNLQIIPVVESKLQDKIFNSLKNLCAGIDPNSAFDILNFWIYICAEKKQKIIQNDIIERLNKIGQFIAEREAHHSEWFRSIIPIEDRDNNREKEKLLEEFYRGISARYDHILADVDKPRISKLNEISQQFRDKQVVIVHGASGQGKTTIAYRYLHDFFPEQWRFQVKLVENRQHAVNIATALSGQAKVLGIPIVVYIDVSPNDIGWVELVKQLSTEKNIQILVTVREEDFRRASISGAEIQFAEIELKFERLEAEEIYQFLIKKETPKRFLDFDDVWNRFGQIGPLMEFVYLVTQGDSLRERLLQQVRRIQDEVRSGQFSSKELEFLRMVSVVSAFEARLKIKELVQYLQLPSAQRTLELLESEYLLRTSENGALVGGLHPIRSTILSDILTDITFNPWSETASACLPFIFEQDVGSFLFYAFSRHSYEVKYLLSALNSYQPDKWIAISGVTNALLWLGIKEYIEANKQIILESYETFSKGWSLALNFDIANANHGVADNLFTNLLPDSGLELIASLRSRQIDREAVFSFAKKWLSRLLHAPISPQTEMDWIGLSEVLFWIGYLEVSTPISDWLAQIDLNVSVEMLSLDILADIALGLFYATSTIYDLWLNINKTKIINRFRQETQTITLEDDGKNIKVHFVIEIVQPDNCFSETPSPYQNIQKDFLNASMTRLALLRRLFPDRERYGSQGYGHLMWINAELHDETEKNISISNFPLQRLVSINATFKALGEQDLRPETWDDYTQKILELRMKNVKILQQLIQELEIFFRKNTISQSDIEKILKQSITSSLWKQTRQMLLRSPWLPRCAFDEWGFITENIDRVNQLNSNDFHKAKSLVLEKYNSYIKAFNDYVCNLSNFFEQAEYVLNCHPYIKKGENLR